MAVCESCGAQLSAVAKFCTGCGAKVTASESVASGRSLGGSEPEDATRRSSRREKTLLYTGIAFAVLLIVALLTPYPGLLLDNYRHVRVDLAYDDAAAESTLASCAIRNDNLRPSHDSDGPLSASVAAAAMQAAIINGEPRKDYYFDEEFVSVSASQPALVYNSPSSERGLLLYECAPGTEMKGRWVRGGVDGSERWLRLTASRYVRDVDLSSPNNDEQSARAAADAASEGAAAVAKAASEAANPALHTAQFAGAQDMVGNDLILTSFSGELPLIDDGRHKCDIFSDSKGINRVGAGAVLNDPNYEDWYLGIAGKVFDFTTQEGEGGYYQGDGYGIGIGIGGFYGSDPSKLDKGEVILVKNGVRTILPVFRKCAS
jgi:hypothetical protein